MVGHHIGTGQADKAAVFLEFDDLEEPVDGSGKEAIVVAEKPEIASTGFHIESKDVAVKAEVAFIAGDDKALSHTRPKRFRYFESGIQGGVIRDKDLDLVRE